jgi:hypothetical protein
MTNNNPGEGGESESEIAVCGFNRNKPTKKKKLKDRSLFLPVQLNICGER